jgi:hypothetical protein
MDTDDPATNRKNDELKCVSKGFDRKVKMFEKYDVNGYRFHTESHQNTRPNAKTVNTGVFTRGADNVEYYGRLQNVYELSFTCGAQHLTLVVFRCHWFDPDDGMRTTPSIGLVEVMPSTTYHGADVFVVAHQATQVYYLPYPCQKEELKGWEVVFKVSPHGKLPMPNEDDYNNIDPITYEGDFYQEEEDGVDFDILVGGLEDLENDAQNRGETVVNIKDIDMLSKLHDDDTDEDEPPPCDGLPYFSRDSDSDSEDETRQLSYESDDSR